VLTILYLALLVVAGIGAALSLDDDVQQLRLRFRGRISLDALRERTGWPEQKVRKLAGEPDTAGLYDRTAELLRKLPWNPWVTGPTGPLPGFWWSAGLAASATRALVLGGPEWLILGIVGGHQILSLAWMIPRFAAMCREEEEILSGVNSAPAEPDDPSLQEILAGLRRLEDGNLDEIRKSQLKAQSPLDRWFDRWIYRWIARKAQRQRQEVTGLLHKTQEMLTSVEHLIEESRAKTDLAVEHNDFDLADSLRREQAELESIRQHIEHLKRG